MANKLTEFRDWLLDQRRFRTAWFAKDPHLTPEPDEALSHLPDNVADELRAAINNLPINPHEEDVVLQDLDEAIARWRKSPRLASNSMVVLAHPVSSVARILVESLHTLRSQKEDPLDIGLLDWVERPSDSGSIEAQIKEKLCDRSGQQKMLAVIPNLCWCFLRSADGLEGVDYLQETLLSDRSQFWVIGSGQVGWQYLKSTLKFHAYCGGSVDLPALTGEQLQAWLEPIVDQFNIRFSDAAIHKRLSSPKGLLKMDISANQPIEAISEISQEVSATVKSSWRAVKDEVFSHSDKSEHQQKEESPKREYFERLADISDGVSIVALQLLVKSLRYRDVLESESEASPKENGGSENPDENPDKEMVAIMPRLPPLPELSQSDLYLLYSLMLHGDLTIRALARSLGDAPQVVNNQVQVLRNAGIIEQKNGVIKTNPIHYPKLRRELARNNFIIEVS